MGLFLPGKTLQENPIHSFTAEEVLGHILWGFIVGAVTMRFRYFLLTGAFAILLRLDHLIGLLHTESISRMSHSITFGIIAVIITMLLFGKKNYLLGATVFVAYLHIFHLMHLEVMMPSFQFLLLFILA